MSHSLPVENPPYVSVVLPILQEFVTGHAVKPMCDLIKYLYGGFDLVVSEVLNCLGDDETVFIVRMKELAIDIYEANRCDSDGLSRYCDDQFANAYHDEELDQYLIAFYDAHRRLYREHLKHFYEYRHKDQRYVRRPDDVSFVKNFAVIASYER